MKIANFKILISIILVAFLFSGCRYGKKAHPKRGSPISYSYPDRGGYHTVAVRNPHYGSHKPTVSRSLRDLDRDSSRVKPTLIYSMPANYRNANLVNLATLKFKMLNLINDLRAAGNDCAPPTTPVNWSKRLEDAAGAHASDMAINKHLGHMGSGKITDVARKATGGGSNFYERIMHFGYPIRPGNLAGEILTYTKYNIVGNKDPYDNFIHAVNNFQQSPRHCAILMNPRFKDIGLAAYKSYDKIYWVIEFGEK